MVSRRRFLLAACGALVVGVARPAAADPAGLVEGWAEQPLGARGVPAGWRPYETPGGRPKYDFEIVDDGGRRALALRGGDDHSTIARSIAVDLRATPVVEWAWKVRRFPEGADLRARATSDATGHLFVVWPRFPEFVRSRLIGYVWDPAAPVDAILPSRKTGTVTFVIVRSGREGLGDWVVTRRDVRADYERIFGEAPPAPKAVALSIDTNDTHSPAEAWFGRIAFVRA